MGGFYLVKSPNKSEGYFETGYFLFSSRIVSFYFLVERIYFICSSALFLELIFC